LPPAGIELAKKLPEEALVLLSADKIPTATQHQSLVHGLLETSMPLFDVTVLVGMVRLNLLGPQPIMGHQSLVTPRELLLLGEVVHRRTQPIRAMPLRNAAQFPQRTLQPRAQALETLGETDRRRLPIRVRQHKVIDHVVERLPLDGHAQAAHAREIRRRQPARLVYLGEEHFLGWPTQCPPAPDLPLQGPQLAVSELPGIPALQLAENRFSLQSGLLFQHRTHLRPDHGERVGPGSPVVWPSRFAG
jgi:hypothetical protein